MARKNNRSGKGSPASGGFVPASTQAVRPGNRSSVDMAPSPTVGVGGAGDADVHVNSGSYSQYSRNAASYTHRAQSGSSGGKKAAIAIVIVILIAAVVGLGFFVYKEVQKNAINTDLHSMTQQELQAVDEELTGMTKFDEPFTMLLLGSDERSDDPTMGARTDTIILVRIDPLHNIISMVSIPRDTMITIPGVGTDKFNAAYTYGGASGTIAAVKDLCGIDIDHYAEVNFEGLVGLIDAIGGVDVYNDEFIDDPDAGDVVIPEGMVHLDGEAALVFSRSRAYADGDFTRVSNQRKLIEAIVYKGLSAPKDELYGLIQASAAFLTTDSGMDVDFIYSLADQIRHNNDYPVTVNTATIPATTTMLNGVSYVVADDYGVEQLMDVFLEGGDVSKYGLNAGLEEDEEDDESSSSSSGASSSYGSSYGSSGGSTYGSSYGYN